VPPPPGQARTAGGGGGGAGVASAGWSAQKKPWRQRRQAARAGASAAGAPDTGRGSGVGAGPRALVLAAGLGGFSCVWRPTVQLRRRRRGAAAPRSVSAQPRCAAPGRCRAHPGSDMKSPKSWLRAWQQDHSLPPSWNTGGPLW
jgi:hypothetical protein